MPAGADSLRIATFNTELSRKGPGLLLRDILRGEDDQIAHVIDVIHQADADVLVLQGFDYDLTGIALRAFADAIAVEGPRYPHHLSLAPNAGLMTPFDLDGDGKKNGAGDAQGYGRFFGAGAMAVLSKHPIDTEGLRDFSALLWRDLPDALLPTHPDGTPFPSAQALEVQRLASHGAWVVPVDTPALGTVNVLTFHAGPPVFDGPEDRNGKRNHDEVMFWHALLDGAFPPAPSAPFVIAGDANQDPDKGDSISTAIRSLLARDDITDPLPDLPTVRWQAVGDLRVDYVLPSAGLRVTGAGRIGFGASEVSRHALVWVDLAR